MRQLLLLFFWLITAFSLKAQIEGVDLKVEEMEHGFMVTEQIRVSEDRPDNLELKALVFRGSDIRNVKVFTEKELVYAKESTQDLILLKVDLKNLNADNLTITYTVQIDQESFYLPIFFTNWNANSSEKGFFDMEFQHPKEKSYFIHFPTVDTDKTIQNDKSILKLQLLALPSTLRVERIDSESDAPSYIAMVDWAVAIVFLIVGFLIWHYRKELMYG